MEIKIYSNAGCSRCKTAKAFLNSQKIAYSEVNIDEDNEAREYLLEKGLSALPVFEIDNNEPQSILTIPELASLLK